MPSGSYPSRRRRKRHHSNRKRLNRINERLHSIATKEQREFTPFKTITQYERWCFSLKVKAPEPTIVQESPKPKKKSFKERRAERKAKSLAAKTARDQRAEANITLEIKTK